MSETNVEQPVIPQAKQNENGSLVGGNPVDAAKPDEVVAAIRKMNLAEKDELQDLGYQVDPEGNVTTPPKKSLLSTVKKAVLGNNATSRQQTADSRQR